MKTLFKLLCWMNWHSPDYEEEPTIKWSSKRYYVHCKHCGKSCYSNRKEVL